MVYKVKLEELIDECKKMDKEEQLKLIDLLAKKYNLKVYE